MLLKALPFFLSYTLAPLVALAALYGGWWIAAPFLWGWVVVTLLDKIMGLDTENLDPTTRDSLLFWHSLVLWLWVPGQVALIYFVLWQVSLGHLGPMETLGVAAGLGVASGGIGITFAHELIHRRTRWERMLGEIILVTVAYGHFATEHVRGHHVTVGTPKDPVTARRGENFYAFLLRAVFGSAASAWRIERDLLARKGRPAWHRSNPWWRYLGGLTLCLVGAFAIAGWLGLLVFAIQAFNAVMQLEAVNYVEHYGLTRRWDGQKFERVRPHHSWNASHRVSNWLLVNLQRHSDHHFRPDRKFPLLQHYSWKEAPQLPFGYPLMIFYALIPPVWFRVMDKRVDRWRQTFYPDMTDWAPYENGSVGETPAPTAVPAE